MADKYWLRFGISLNCKDMSKANRVIKTALANQGIKVDTDDDNRVEENLDPNSDVAFWFWYQLPDRETTRRAGDFLHAHRKAREACPGISEVKPRASAPREWEPFKGRGDSLVDVLPCMVRVRQGVPEGMRDDALFWLACGCFRDGVSKAEAMSVVLDAAAHCKPPFPPSLARQKVESAYRRGGKGLQCRLTFLHDNPTLCSTKCPFYKPGIGAATDDGEYIKGQKPKTAFPWSGKLWANQ